MKKIFALTVFLIISGCAKERTTPYFSNQEQMLPEEPVSFVLTNEDYEQQKSKELYDSLDVPEVKIGLPEGVICEIIPQLRMQKLLGRVNCIKQSPLLDDQAVNLNQTTYTCKIDETVTAENTLSDQKIFEALKTIEDVNNKKTIGTFYCQKLTEAKCGILAN